MGKMLQKKKLDHPMIQPKANTGNPMAQKV